MEMTPSAIKKICQDCKGYGTAYLNDVLYLHHKVRAAQSGGSPTLLALRARTTASRSTFAVHPF